MRLRLVCPECGFTYDVVRAGGPITRAELEEILKCPCGGRMVDRLGEVNLDEIRRGGEQAVVVTDPGGNRTRYESVAEAGRGIGVSGTQVFMALMQGFRCHGCRVEPEGKEENNL